MNTDRLDALILKWSQSTLDSTEAAELDALLRNSTDARSRFRRHARLDAALREHAAPAQLSAVAIPVRSRWRQPTLFTLAAGLAALLCVGAFFLGTRRPSANPVRTEDTIPGCATLSQTLDAEFAAHPLRSGDTIAPGAIKLTRGLAQIEFFSGATALIEGGAEIEIVSAWEVRCLSGRVRVHVPPAARGFLMHAPGMKLEDLGTEFALNVDAQQQSAAVHVFDGEVIAYPNPSTRISLTTGMGLSRDARGQTGSVTAAQDFLVISELQALIAQREQRRFQQWQTWSKQARPDPRLIAYYTFKHWADDRWDRVINNFTIPPQKQRVGGAVGARWTEGRWPGKEALEFKRPGDRVRMDLDGTYSALTFSCWVKVDSVDKKYNSLLLTDGYDNGEPHWQIYEDGRLMFSIIYRPDGEAKRSGYNQIYYSNPVFTADSLGRWHHLAVTYESQSGAVTQYFDGREVGREVSKLHQPGRNVVFGPCEIGNWGLPTSPDNFPIRNLNGAIDEFAIYRAALSAAEIQDAFENGKPE